MNDKIKVVLVGVIVVLVILTSLLLTGTLLAKGKTVEVVLPIAIILILGIFMIPFVRRRYFDVKAGYPYEDERSKKVMTNALAKAYLISLWWLLAIGWASDDIIAFRDVSQATGAGIAGMAVIFGLCYWYYNRKGDIE